MQLIKHPTDVWLSEALSNTRWLEYPLAEADAVFAKVDEYFADLGLSRVGAKPIECPIVVEPLTLISEINWKYLAILINGLVDSIDFPLTVISAWWIKFKKLILIVHKPCDRSVGATRVGVPPPVENPATLPYQSVGLQKAPKSL